MSKNLLDQPQSNLMVGDELNESNAIDNIILAKLQPLLASENIGFTQLDFSGLALTQDLMDKITRWFIKNANSQHSANPIVHFRISQTPLQDTYFSTLFCDKTFANFRITSLELSYSNLTQFPMGLRHLPNLEELILDHNQISLIPDHLEKDLVSLPKLHTLSLEKNCLTQIPQWLANLPALEWLTLEKNPLPISQIPKEVLERENLCILHLSELGQEIIPGLFLAGSSCASSTKFLIANKIKHIINLSGATYTHGPEVLGYYPLTINDLPSSDIQQFFSLTQDIICRASEKDEAVLVHCAAGMSRSASIVISYIMQSQRMKFIDALRFVRQRRPCANPNIGFKQQLRDYERQIFSQTNQIN